MADRKHSPLNSYRPKFRRHHPHAHSRPRHLDHERTSPPKLRARPDIAVHLDSPKGSNEVLVVDVFDGANGGKEGHTSVAIYSTNPTAGLPAPQQITKTVPTQRPPIKRSSKPRSKSESDNVSQTKGDSAFFDPSDFFLMTSRDDILYQWGSNDVDTQEVASDTLDLDRIMPAAPFLLNFSHYDEKDIALHVGLRRKHGRRVVVKNYSPTFIPPCTDDYNREFFRYLKTKENLETLKFILEIYIDDDPLQYKCFDEDLTTSTSSRPFDSGEILENSDFPVIRSNFATFWATKTIPNKLTFIHVELPGLSAFYLNDWKRFLELQTRLVTLICSFGSVLWTFYKNVIPKNEKTLEKVVLRRLISYDVRNQRHVPLDFGIFEKCEQLNYLKITGGGYKERWGEWVTLGQENDQEEILLNVNLDLIPLENLLEFHYCRMSINKTRLQELAIACQDKKLRLICCNCPDREFTDGDWPIDSSDQSAESDKAWEIEDMATTIELAMQFGGHSTSRRHIEYYRKQQQQKQYLITFLLILCTLAFLGMTAAVIVAIAYSNKGRHDRM